MFQKLWTAALGLGLVSALVINQSAEAGGRPGGSGSRPTYSSLLSAFDKNRDTMLSSGEVPSPIWSRLKVADTNGDNIVTQGEFVAAGGKP